MRSFITFVSIILIISLYTMLTSIGNSFTVQIAKAIDEQDIDIAVQARFATSPVSSRIPAETVKTLIANERVERSEALLVGRKLINGSTAVYILGVSNYGSFANRLGVTVLRGEPIESAQAQLVIGEKISRILDLDVGDTLKLDSGQPFLVSGVYSSWLDFLNSGMIVDLEHSQSLTGNTDRASLLLLKLNNSAYTDRMIDTINKTFPEMRAMKSAQLPDFIGPIKSFFFFSKIVSLLTLVIGVAILVNTFVMAISERTREIGILSAIGWPRSLTLLVVQIESLILAMSGGLVGYLVSFPIMSALKNNYSVVSAYLPAAPELNTFLSVMLMCVFVSLLSSLFPVFYGTNIQIVKALHHE